MLDILEEWLYMVLRQLTYLRLDGSSNIEDRRDMVSDYQSDSSIFCFLLSTRAGGLGINLTAADTVVFYDTDWNPTMDAQAMDRCHRIGQVRDIVFQHKWLSHSVVRLGGWGGRGVAHGAAVVPCCGVYYLI